MWQRPQTFYLAISTILIAIMFFGIKAVTVGADGTPTEEFKYITYFPYLVLLIVIGILNILALTTFKVRMFQFRTAVLAALVTLALQIWLAVDFFSTHDTMVFKLSAVFPIIAVILDVMAARGIMADQFLVDNAEHLRKARRERRSKRK